MINWGLVRDLWWFILLAITLDGVSGLHLTACAATLMLRWVGTETGVNRNDHHASVMKLFGSNFQNFVLDSSCSRIRQIILGKPPPSVCGHQVWRWLSFCAISADRSRKQWAEPGNKAVFQLRNTPTPSDPSLRFWSLNSSFSSGSDGTGIKDHYSASQCLSVFKCFYFQLTFYMPDFLNDKKGAFWLVEKVAKMNNSSLVTLNW